MHNLAITLQVGKWPLTKCIFRFFARSEIQDGRQGTFFGKNFETFFWSQNQLRVHFRSFRTTKKFFCSKKIFPPKNFFFLCIRNFSDVFGPRAKAICTSALKLSTMENMLIMMNFNDFRTRSEIQDGHQGAFFAKKNFLFKIHFRPFWTKKIFFFST